MANEKYFNLITSAINDFDAIHSALETKKVVYSGKEVSTADSLPTSQMDDLIKAQLWRIGDRGVSGSAPTLSDGKVVDYGNSTLTSLGLATDGGVTSSANGLTITTAHLPGGYYENNFSINLNAVLEPAKKINTTTDYVAPTEEGKLGKYSITASAGKILGSVEINEGKITNTNTVTFEQGSSVAPEATPDFGTLAISTQNSTGAYSFTITPNATLTGKAISTVNASLTEGYIKDSNVDLKGGEVDLSGLNAIKGTADTYYIAKGQISNLTTGDAAVKMASSDIFLETGKAGNKDYYAISGKVKTGDTEGVQITGKTTAGYVETSNAMDLGHADITDETLYVKKTSLAMNKTDNIELGVETDADKLVSSTGEYTITVGGTKTVTGKVAPGYVKTEDSVTDTVSGTFDVKIAHGRVSEKLKSTVSAESGSATLVTSGGYDFTVTHQATTDIAQAVKEGYVKTGDVSITTAESKTETFHVKEGSITPTLGLKADVKAGSEEDGKDSTVVDGEKVNLFVPEAAIDKKYDYYEVTATAGATINDGYVTASRNKPTNSIEKLFIQKATFEYVKSDVDASEDFIQVKTGGYIPAGVIKNIATITGTPDMAAGTLIAGDNSEISFNNNGYKIPLVTSISSAGYIAANNNIVGELSVQKGAIEVTANKNTFNFGNATFNSETKRYNVSVTGSVTTNATFSEGYIKANDFTVGTNPFDSANNKSIVTEVSETVVLDKAVLNVVPNTLALSESHKNITLSATEKTKYTIKPELSGKAKATVTSAGYVSEDDNYEVELTTTNITGAPTYYIKEGSVAALTGTNKSGDLRNTAIALDSGTYKTKVSGSIKVSGEITEGYVDNGTAEGTATVENYVIDLGKAAATVTPVLSGKVDTQLVTHQTGDSTNYIAINAKASSNSGTALDADITKGYLGAGNEITIAAVPEATKDTVYVETLSTTYPTTVDATGTDDAGHNVSAKVYVGGTMGSLDGDIDDVADVAHRDDTAAGSGLRNTLYVDTSEKYAKHDVKVTLSEHAMGTKVVDEFKKLRARLQGTYNGGSSVSA